MQSHRHMPDSVLRWRESRALVLVPLVMVAAIMVIDALTGPGIHLAPLLIVAPAITASFAGPRLVALIGGLAVAGSSPGSAGGPRSRSTS